MKLPKQSGLTLIELMIAIALGLFILLGLTALFASSSRSQRDLSLVAQQIENGRYALETISQDLKHAGFYGDFQRYTLPGSTPDACSTTAGNILAATGLPVQGFNSSGISIKPSPSTSCGAGTLLPAANLKAGSDILVVRRADTVPLAIGAKSVIGTHYIQSIVTNAEIQVGNGSTMTDTSTATGATATLKQRNTKAALIRQFYVHVYFVAPCSIPNGGGAVCTGSSDDGGNPIPTLKRLDLDKGTFSIVPIAEGIEYLKVEYGIDSFPTDIHSLTGLIGDGVVNTAGSSTDKWESAPSLAEFGNVVSVRLSILARNPESSRGYTDNKSYTVGELSVPATNDDYRRHVYAREVRLTNLSARRERP